MRTPAAMARVEAAQDAYEHPETIDDRILRVDLSEEGHKVYYETGEVRTVSPTGGEKGVKPEQYQSIPVTALRELAEHFAKGAEKYGDHNFRKGYEWSKSYSALLRHLMAFWGGEDIDPETGSKHVTAVAWHALALSTFMDEHPQFDDRYINPKDES